jgi:DNA-binding protein HU-beta
LRDRARKRWWFGDLAAEFHVFSKDFCIFLLASEAQDIYPLTRHMAKTLTKSQIAATVAESAEITKKQATQAIEALVNLAYKNAKNTFTIPGLGKLVLVNRKARMGRNPATGQPIKIAAKRVVKFRVAKAAKDAILGSKK